MAKRLGENNNSKVHTKKVSHKRDNVSKKISLEVKSTSKVDKPSIKISVNKGAILKTILYAIVFLLAFSIIDLFVQYLNNSYSVAVVNGVRISNKDFNERLQKAYGSTAVQAIIDEELILQEGKKNKINITNEQIQQELSTIEEQIGGKDALNQALVANNLTIEDLEKQIKIKLIKVEILKPTITYTDEELQKFFDANKEYLYEENAEFEDRKNDVTTKYIEQQIDAAQSGWILQLRESSKIQNNITEKPKYGFLKTTINIVTNLYNILNKK